EQVVDAAEVPRRIVAAEARAEMAVQRDRVELVLQEVVVRLHRGGESRRCVLGADRAEKVRFPIDDVPAAVVLEDEIDEAAEKSRERRKPEALDAIGVAGTCRR